MIHSFKATIPSFPPPLSPRHLSPLTAAIFTTHGIMSMTQSYSQAPLTFLDTDFGIEYGADTQVITHIPPIEHSVSLGHRNNVHVYMYMYTVHVCI